MPVVVLSEGYAARYICHKMTYMASLVEEKYIQETLAQAADYIYKEQTSAIREATGPSSTGFLLNNRAFSVAGNSFQHRHPIYERFLDMKHLKRDGKTIKRKPLHIHNRFMWGLYLRVQERLLYGLTEDVRKRFRESLGVDDQYQAYQK